MPLSWNEIKSRALAFTNEWKDETSEDAEAKSFWDEFFFIFDLRRRKLASFEHHVKQLNNKDGYVDLFWPGTLIVEHKSKGKNLDKAHGQVLDYFHGIPDKQLPQYILVSDFARFRLYDLDNNTVNEFTIDKLTENIGLFGFIAGYQKRTYKEQDPVNIRAAELMGRLHDKLKAIGYNGFALERYLVRLVFLLFADDTNIFDERGIFFDYLDQHTKEDGSDLAAHLAQLFEILNTPKDKRLRNIDESQNAFPYVNGKLFEEHLPTASFDSEMRKILMDCCMLDWGKISPAIFGSLFQSVMDTKARRNLGAHYTSEKNILKLIKPLFLDELYTEFSSIKESKQKLQKFHNKISGLRFLDPACGCGNFLIIAYRELRLLEIEIIKQRLKLEGIREEVAREAQMDVSYLVQCDVDRFYGIEYEEFPAQIAQVAMWLIDHQMNQVVTNTFGDYYVRLPLRKSATIVNGNALQTDWQSLIDPLPWEKGAPKYDYIMGNPPFIGKQYQTAQQKADMDAIFHGVNGAGVLDYVTAWYIKAAQYMQQYNFLNPTEDTSMELPLRRTLVQQQEQQLTKAAFVSTNSISQGEQVGVLWNELFNSYKIKIHFAHRTFSWSNEAKGNAAVHVVIIGFANFDTNGKLIYEYESIKAAPHEIKVKNINPYLVEGKDNFIPSRKQPICNIPPINYGSMANDGGHLLLNDDEKNDILLKEPEALNVIRPFLGSQEFINKINRWCIWLKDVPPNNYSHLKAVLQRVREVKEYRLKSTRPATQKLADFPMLFGEIRQPETSYLLIPGVSSENRKYIPIGFLSSDVIASDLARTIPNANPYLFGVLTSLMHMTWVKYICGRLKSDFRYSNSLVYNNYPWPETSTEKQVQAVEAAAQQVLNARLQFPKSSLADLYDPNTMPPILVKAHQTLDKAVDQCYRPQAFINETKRIEFLFELYDKYTAGLFVNEKKKK